MKLKVHKLDQSVADDGTRPDMVTYQDPDGRFKSLDGYKEVQSNTLVSAGDPDYPPKRWFVPNLFASTPGRTAITAWDFYSTTGSSGVFSPRSIEVLKPYFGDRFSFLEARLEGHLYYCLHCRSSVDCLNRESSQIAYYKNSSPPKVKRIDKYCFHMELLEEGMIFSIPDDPLFLFCTNPVSQVVAKAGLCGFEFPVLDDGKR